MPPASLDPAEQLAVAAAQLQVTAWIFVRQAATQFLSNVMSLSVELIHQSNDRILHVQRSLWVADGLTIHHPRGTGKTCCFALHSPVAYSQAHRNPQHWLALPGGSNPAPAHYSRAYVQLDSEPRMTAGQAFPLARDVFLVMPVGRCGSNVAAAALRTVHGLVIVGCAPSLAYGELRRLDGGGTLHRAEI